MEKIVKMCLNVQCRVKFIFADLRFRFLRLSTTRKCTHLLRSDYRVIVVVCIRGLP